MKVTKIQTFLFYVIAEIYNAVFICIYKIIKYEKKVRDWKLL